LQEEGEVEVRQHGLPAEAAEAVGRLFDRKVGEGEVLPVYLG
jgi:hypothetical protein